jgi:hypothetical protein
MRFSCSPLSWSQKMLALPFGPGGNACSSLEWPESFWWETMHHAAKSVKPTKGAYDLVGRALSGAHGESPRVDDVAGRSSAPGYRQVGSHPSAPQRLLAVYGGFMIPAQANTFKQRGITRKVPESGFAAAGLGSAWAGTSSNSVGHSPSCHHIRTPLSP